MKKRISELDKNEQVTDFFMIKSQSVRISNKGEQYMDLVIGDNSGEMSAKIWDLSHPDVRDVLKIQGREIVKINGMVNEWNGRKQLKIIKLRKLREDDNVDLSELIRTSPIEAATLYEQIYKLAESIKDAEYRKLTLTLMEENKEKLLYFPAAAKNHHAEKGGLLYHVYRMLQGAEALSRIYTILSRDLLVCGVILHDIAKLEEIDADELGMADQYTVQGQLLGHIVQGITLIDRVSRRLNISEEKMLMIEHMILSHHYEPEYGSPKKPMFPEAQILHYLDVIDANMYDMEKALDGVAGGDFSEKIWSLDNRKMYKPSYGE